MPIEAIPGASGNHTASASTATESELRGLFSIDEDDGPEPLEAVIPTHSGEWRREGDLWRWWQSDEVEED